MPEARTITPVGEQAKSGGVSVVVCTIGRLQMLEACLAALRAQTLTPAEIIVVLAGDAVDAKAFLSAQSDVTLLTIDRMNVSASRNAGIRAAACPIVAFCDDDAVAQGEWLEEMVEVFADGVVAGCGGKVLDARSEIPEVVFNNGLIRLSGRRRPVCDEPGDFNDPAGFWYNNVCGCSCAFRREALIDIDGFDEFIEFAYDEADVCVRLIQLGRRIAHAPAAVVRHGFAPGGYRRDELVRDWCVEFKNQLYFGLANRTGWTSAVRTIGRVAGRMVYLGVRFAGAACAGRMGVGRALRQCGDVIRGALRGLKAGLRGRGDRPRFT